MPDLHSFDDQNAQAGPDAGPLERAFFGHRGRIVHKWHHYLPIYDRYFSRFRGKKVGMLEIGVFKGGSMELWHKYFGRESFLMGIDIDESCRRFDMDPCAVRIGDQSDPKFLENCAAEFPAGIDIIIDDGSHVSTHVAKSFDFLFPRLNENGLYVIEDLHTAYWPEYKGGFGEDNASFSHVMKRVDDMHHWYHNRAMSIGGVSAIHIHDSITIFEKKTAGRPTQSMRGSRLST